MSETGKPAENHVSAPRKRWERREVKHLSTCRKGKKLDSPSSGERTGTSPNQCSVKLEGVAAPGLRELQVDLERPRELQNSFLDEWHGKASRSG
jgi:hypothetical protein